MPDRVEVSPEWTGAGGLVHSGVVTPPSASLIRRRARVAEGERVRSGGVPVRPIRGASGWEFTSQDEACVAGLLRFGAATWRQCAATFYGDRSDITHKRRLKYLREVGWVRSEVGETWYGNVLWATGAGARIMADQMRVPLGAGGYPGNSALHRLAVTDLGFQMISQRQTVLTEREVRALEGNHDRLPSVLHELGVSSPRSAPDGQGVERVLAPPVGKDGRVHYPDLVHVRPGQDGVGMNAVELEITPKLNHRLRQILFAYRDSQLFDRVLYYASGQVAAQMQGWYDREGKWRDGILQKIGMYPSGQDPTEWVRTHRPMVVVIPVSAHDEGVAYRLDMRQVPEASWVTKREWQQLRAAWREWCEDQEAVVPFLRWWQDIYELRRATGVA